MWLVGNVWFIIHCKEVVGGWSGNKWCLVDEIHCWWVMIFMTFPGVLVADEKWVAIAIVNSHAVINCMPHYPLPPPLTGRGRELGEEENAIAPPLVLFLITIPINSHWACVTWTESHSSELFPYIGAWTACEVLTICPIRAGGAVADPEGFPRFPLKPPFEDNL
jgi:hypothetical protein